MRALLVTNRYPTATHPDSGVHIPLLAAALQRSGVASQVLHLDRHARGPGVYVSQPGALSGALASYDPDVVHVLWGGVAAAITTSVVRHRPVLVTYGGTDLLGSYRQRGDGLTRHLSRNLAVLASHFAARRATVNIVVSHGLGRALPVDCRSVTIGSGVDPRRFRALRGSDCRARLGWAEDKHHVLFAAATNRPEKRHDVAALGVERLRSRGYPVELHALQGVAHHAVPQWMNAADVVLLTSRHEGDPKVIKEALACGRPIVATAVGSVPELLQGVPRCRVVEHPSPDELADAISSVWKRGAEEPGSTRPSLASWDEVARRIAEQYREALARHHPRSRSSVVCATDRARAL